MLFLSLLWLFNYSYVEDRSNNRQEKNSKDHEVRFLAFQRTRGSESEIGIVDEFGKSIKILAKGGLYHPENCWSPDGRQIAFTTGRGIIHEINVIQTDGSDKTQLTNLGQYSSFCDWFPNQNKILFVTGKNDGHWSAAEVSLDSKKVTILAENAQGLFLHLPKRKYINLYLPKAPDIEISLEGEEISQVQTFSTPDRTAYIKVQTNPDGSSIIFLSKANGRGLRTLATMRGMELSQFSISPDGQKIAYVARPSKININEDIIVDEKQYLRVEGIFVIGVDGGEPRLVVEEGFRPVWGPLQSNKVTNRIPSLEP